MSNSLVCVDANIVVRLVVENPRGERVARLWETWCQEGRPFVAPSLLYYEVANALHRYQHQGILGREAVAFSLDAALGLKIALYDDANLHRRALDLAHHLSLPATYDAHYLALAERMGAEFWTADQRLVQAVSPALPWVHLVT